MIILRTVLALTAAVAGPAWDALEYSGAFEVADAVERAAGLSRPRR